MRLAMRVAGETLPDNIDALETVWRDASTPTIAQRADAVVKMRQAGLISLRQARQDLGYSREQIAAMEVDDAKAVDRVLGGDMAALVGPKPEQQQQQQPDAEADA